jgi:dihydroorotate dehydrogenase
LALAVWTALRARKVAGARCPARWRETAALGAFDTAAVPVAAGVLGSYRLESELKMNMEPIALAKFEARRAKLKVEPIGRLIQGASEQLDISPEELLREARADSSLLHPATKEVDSSIFWPIARYLYEKRLIDRIPMNGMPFINYDPSKDIDLERSPLGMRADFSRLKLANRPVVIAGRKVDFPLGVPASMLTANASFLKYYAERGFCILTYKTVRSREHHGNKFPQWACVTNPAAFRSGPNGELLDAGKLVARTDYLPENPEHGTMANSFGVPSYAPSWWKDDLEKVREFVRDGQLLIVSVMSSVGTDVDLETIANDFAETAIIAKACGADVIELNYSCPNTREHAGEIYLNQRDSARISEVVREAVGSKMPVYVKIGYLSDVQLHEFVAANFRLIDGIVAINTISAPIINESKKELFPGRAKAGVSGWAVRDVAHRLAQKLVAVRDEFHQKEGKRLDLLGLGGIMTPEDFDARLATGVDAVEVCTGAYLNPYLGFEIRNAQGNIEVIPDVAIMDSAQTAGRVEATLRLPSGANEHSHDGVAPMENRHKVDAKKTKALSKKIDPEKLGRAFDAYFERRSTEEIVDGLNDRSPELLIALAGIQP